MNVQAPIGGNAAMRGVSGADVGVAITTTETIVLRRRRRLITAVAILSALLILGAAWYAMTRGGAA